MTLDSPGGEVGPHDLLHQLCSCPYAHTKSVCCWCVGWRACTRGCRQTPVWVCALCCKCKSDMERSKPPPHATYCTYTVTVRRWQLLLRPTQSVCGGCFLPPSYNAFRDLHIYMFSGFGRAWKPALFSMYCCAQEFCQKRHSIRWLGA